MKKAEEREMLPKCFRRAFLYWAAGCQGERIDLSGGEKKRICQERRHLELTCVQFLLLSLMILNHLLHYFKPNRALESSVLHLNSLLQSLLSFFVCVCVCVFQGGSV